MGKKPSRSRSAELIEGDGARAERKDDPTHPFSPKESERNRISRIKVMEAQDYRSNNLLEDGILQKGMAVSVLAHIVVLLLALGAPWLMPRKIDPPLCTVSLFTLHDLGGGAGGGEEGAMSKGNGELKPAGGSEAIPPPPEPQAASEPEPEKSAAVPLTEVVKETVPLVSVPQKVEKPLEKPKPKQKPAPRPPQKEQVTAKAEAPPPFAPRTNSEGTGAPDGTLSGHGEGLGRGDADGAAKGRSGEGAGAGSGTGTGAGGGQGPYNATFGSGDGPRFVAKVLPKYPRLARELRKEGTVQLLVTIDDHGRLIDVEVVQRAGSGFDEEALRAVKSSTFCPARRNGKPVVCKAHLPILFQLKEKDGN
jgi:protein TonB